MKTKFSEYIESQKNRTATFVFGRFQPPTIGHERLFTEALAASDSASDLFIFGSNSHDSKKNPLLVESKLMHMRMMFPMYYGNIIIREDINNFLEAATWLNEKGYSKLRMFAGSDRAKEFKMKLNKYNQDLYEFNSIDVQSVVRDNSTDHFIESVNATYARNCAAVDDLENFKKCLPEGYMKTQELFEEVKRGLKK